MVVVAVARKGVEHHFAKLDPDKVRRIRKRYNAGGISILTLAVEYGVAYDTMHSVVSRITWAHVKDDDGS